ncbi:MAG TPA: mechanosensitive ion channel family protein [Candidatus Krumholzibacteria bacterium]|nr:mechanosensitive ion channel family protein [Candidatus Krumholzibacteria bacterium]
MNEYLPLILETCAMALIWLLSVGLTRPLQHRKHLGPGARGTRMLGALLTYAARPLLVILLTELALVAARPWAPLAAWRASHADHLDAWRMFWLGVAALSLLDGLVHAFFAWRRRDFPLPDLLHDILRAVLMLALAFGVLKAELGIDIGPLLASTALLTAVIGFALQGVLGNLLAGMSLHLTRSLRPGAWVRIDDLEGRVTATNWRETRLRDRRGHMWVIPNGKVAEARINNYQDPTPLRAHQIEVGASYSDAPDEVIEALVQAALEVPEVRRSPAPRADITSYLDFGINYRLLYWTTDYPRHVIIDGEVNRMIWYQFKRRGIEIPFPMSDVLLNDFMAVVYNQRRIPPSERQLDDVVADLRRSKLVTELVTDDQGLPLLDDDDLRQVAPRVRRLRYARGETLCRQGDDGDVFWVLVKGALAGAIAKDGGEIDFQVQPGAVVGEMSLLTGVCRSATLTVTASAEVLEFDASAFGALLSLHDELPARLSDLAAARAAQNRAALEESARDRAAEREVVLERDGILGRLLRFVKGSD